MSPPASQVPTIDNIRSEDLTSASARAALEFVALAEKALADDTEDTPGALFFALIKSRDGSRVNQAAETRAMARWPSHMRHELVETAGDEPQLLVTPGDVEDALATQDVGTRTPS